ncbi:MAG: hypothetical protein R3A10_02765 [Caldilineaceae bacterium]
MTVVGGDQGDPHHPGLPDRRTALPWSTVQRLKLRWIATWHGWKNVTASWTCAASSGGSGVLSLTLDDVYVSLAVAVQPDRKQRRQRLTREAANEPRLLDMRELLGAEPAPGGHRRTRLRQDDLSADHRRRSGPRCCARATPHLCPATWAWATPCRCRSLCCSATNRYRRQFADSAGAAPRHADRFHQPRADSPGERRRSAGGLLYGAC